MCLIVDTLIPKVAEKDIICYKALKVKKFLFWKKYYATIYHHFRYKIGKLYTEKSEIEVERMCECHELYMLGKGLFHTALTIKRANEYYYPGEECVTAKCIIPKGTEYFENANIEEYASKAIKVVEIIKRL